MVQSRLLLLLSGISLCAGLAFGDAVTQVVGIARTLTPMRADVQPDNTKTIMVKALYDDCPFWQSLTYDDGTNYYDLSDRMNDAQQTNAGAVPAYSNGYLQFGGDDYVESLNPANVASVAGSVSVWYRSTNDNSSVILSATDRDSAAANRFAVFVGDNVTGTLANELITLIQQSNNALHSLVGYTTATRSQLFDGAWHHIGVTADGAGTYKIYLDGVSRTVSIGSGVSHGLFTNFDNLDCVTIGAHQTSANPATSFLVGAADNAEFFTRVLTSNEMFNLYTYEATQPRD